MLKANHETNESEDRGGIRQRAFRFSSVSACKHEIYTVAYSDAFHFFTLAISFFSVLFFYFHFQFQRIVRFKGVKKSEASAKTNFLWKT